MAEHLLQRFANMGSSTTPGPPGGPQPPSMATLSQRIHHEPFMKYPVYGPGSGPDIFEDGIGEYWHGESGPGGFFPGGPPPPALPPVPFRFPYAGKFGKGRFKGASVAILTFIGFLFFLSVLQNYIRDYSTTNTPTVIVLSSGATKENLPPQQQYPFLQKNDGVLSGEEDDRYAITYKKGTSSNRDKRPKNQKRQQSSDGGSSPPPLFTDLLTVNGLKK